MPSLQYTSPTILGLALCIAAPVTAMAATGLKSSLPPMNGTVAAAPTELDLTFAERFRLKGTGVRLEGPDKKAVALAPSSFGPGGETTLVVPIAAPVATGTYMVEWHMLGADGRKARGTYTFTIVP